MMSDKKPINNLRDPDKKGFFLSIRSKMLIYFGSMFIIVLTIFLLSEMFGIPFTTFRGEFKQHQSEAFQNLSLIADLKKERLLHWIEGRRDDSRALSESSVIKSYVELLLPVINENIANGVRGNKLLTELQKEKSYQYLTQHLNLVKTAYGVYDRIQIADALGTIIASTRNEGLGIDISQHVSFSKIFHQGHNEIIIIDKDPVSGALKLFVSHTIKFLDNEDKTSAVLIMHINTNDFIKPMLHTGGGLGRTGEALLVNQDVKILTTLKHPLEDGTTANPLEYQIKAKPAILAAQGQEGIIVTRDYRGKEVLAAFRHIRITSELGWGLVVKRDRAEVFAPLRESVYYRFIIVSFCALLLLGLIIIIARNLSRPLRRLSKAAREIQEGNLDVRTSITTSDEVGILATAFNSMIQHVQNWNNALKRQVDARTAELEAKNAELERYAYTVSHDLKSPLITIKGFLGLLERDAIKGDTERVKKDISRIHSAAEKMNQLLDDLLELSRIGQIIGTREEVPFEYLANESLNLVRGQIKELGVQVEIAPDLPVIHVDRRRLVEVLQNLIDNAAKHMGKQPEPHIEIGTRQDNEETVYYVRDNGVGIEPCYHENVFGLFNKLDNESEGTGIGLAIVRRIVEVHGGRIWVESKGKEKGSTFCFTIPEKGEKPDHE
ncbi:MAG: sensor histidine kinase [Candidatus Scalindua sp.]